MNGYDTDANTFLGSTTTDCAIDDWSILDEDGNKNPALFPVTISSTTGQLTFTNNYKLGKD